MRLFAGCVIEVRTKQRDKITYGTLDLEAPTQRPDELTETLWANQSNVYIARVALLPDKPYGPPIPVSKTTASQYRPSDAVYIDNSGYTHYEASLPIRLEIGDVIAFQNNVYEYPVDANLVPNSKPDHKYFLCKPSDILCVVKNGRIETYGHRVFGHVLNNRQAYDVGLNISKFHSDTFPDEEYDSRTVPFVQVGYPNEVLLATFGHVGYMVFDWEYVGLTPSETLPRSLRWVSKLSLISFFKPEKPVEFKASNNYDFMPIVSNI
jgi:hypothetical protein